MLLHASLRRGIILQDLLSMILDVDKVQVVVKGDKLVHISAPTSQNRLTGHYLGSLVRALENESEETFVILSENKKDGNLQFNVVIGVEAKSRVHFSKQHAREFVI
jgi:hypothetical protein